MMKLPVLLFCLIEATAIFCENQAVGPIEDRVKIPIQGSGNSSTRPISNGELMDASGVDGGEATGEAARHAKGMKLDSIRQSKLGLIGRPGHKSGWILTANKTMERIHDAADGTADYIHQIRTAKKRLNGTIASFQGAFTGLWAKLSEFKISDLWDIRRKWSRGLDDQIFGLTREVYEFEEWMYSANFTSNRFIDAYENLFGTQDIEDDLVLSFGAIVEKDTLFQDLKRLEQAAIRTLLINKSIDSLMNKHTDSKWNHFLEFVGKLSLNEDLIGLTDLSDIEIELSKTAAALKRPDNSYNDFLILKGKLERVVLKLDKHIAVLNQNEALLSAAELKVKNTENIAEAVFESQFANAFMEGDIQ